MAKVLENKLRLLYIMRILTEETDEKHTITLPELLVRLSDMGISAERKSIYDDFETLREFGLNIQKTKTKTFNYYLADNKRKPASKSEPSHSKLDTVLNNAVSACRDIKFQYSRYEVSPNSKKGISLKLVWDTEYIQAVPVFLKNGSLICVDKSDGELREYFVDRIRNLTAGEKAEELSLELENIVIEAEGTALDDVIGKLGEPSSAEAGKKGKLLLSYTLPVCDAVLLELISLRKGAKVVSPKKLCEQIRDRTKTVSKQYKD